MGLTGIPYQKIEVPFAAGLSTKNDPRALQPPGLLIAQNVEFDDLGGLRTRYPFAFVGQNILGGGTLANVRRVFSNGDELCCFTKDTLYSWIPESQAWISRGTHLAVSVTERALFVSTGDQIDSDRAELNGVAVYAWVDGGAVYAAARSTSSRAVIAGPVAQTATGSRPRLVACATRIMLFYLDSGNLVVKAIDPANVASSFAAASQSLAILAASSYYDVTRVLGADQVVGACRRSPTTAYTVFTVTAGGAVNATAPARTCDGPIAVSSTPDGAHVQVVRANGTAIQGDLITISTLADVFTGQAIGTATSNPSQIAAAHRSVQDGGHYRCYCWWSIENGALAGLTHTWSNWVDDGGNLGTAASFALYLGLGSRAFDRDGHVYVWLTFGSPSGFQGDAPGVGIVEAQNAYFLYRDDAFLAAKAVYNAGGGLAPSIGRLPGVASVDGVTYSWCATERRKLSLASGSSSYAARSPREVIFTFDSNEARRTARIGKTLYIAGGEVLQYDGTQLAEAGFHLYPWYFDAMHVGAGNVPNGSYGRKTGWRWQNAKGESERSTTAAIGTATMSGGPGLFVTSTWFPLVPTHKLSPAPAVEVWRTQVNPPDAAPYYLISSSDPTATGGDNAYVGNDPTLQYLPTWNDNMTDATASDNEGSPDNDALPSLSPPAASIILATNDRIFLAGVAGDPDAVWYSKQRNEGEVAAFFGTLRVALPPDGGAMTGLALVEETPVVFRQRAIWTLRGDGFDNTGGGSNYVPVRASSDVGAVNPDAIAVGPFGAIFKSSKGWYILPPDLVEPKYIGDKVAKFDGDTVLAVHVMESRHQVRIVTNARMLVWDYLVGEWAEWTIADGVHACMWNGAHVYAAATGPKQEQSTYAAVDYGWDVQMAFFKPPGLMGRMTVRRFDVLGEYRAACSVRIRCARDYQQDGAGNWSYYDDVTWVATPTTVGGPLQVRHGPSQKRCEALSVRLTSLAPDKVSQPTAESPKLTGIAFDIGVEDGLYSQLPAGQKT